MRAVAIRVDDIGDVVPDSYVDVTTTRTSHATLLLANVKVLAVVQSDKRSLGDLYGPRVHKLRFKSEVASLKRSRYGTSAT